MRNSSWIPGLVTMMLLASASPAAAQFWPGNPYLGYGWGGYPRGQNAVTREIAGANQRLGQVAAMGQNAVVQGGIRNTLSSQAQDRTSELWGQQQANRDWWFQTQEQQAAQRRAHAYSSAAPPGCGGGLGSAAGGFGPINPPPEAAMDIIKWPTALQGREFASRRTLVEAPYRRSPPELSAPTPDDYRNMVTTVEEMKAILESLLGRDSGLLTQDYEQAKVFLDKMGQEARDRSNVRGASPAQVLNPYTLCCASRPNSR